MKRIKAIAKVYGEKAVKNNRAVKCGKEVVTAWAVIGFETFEDLKRHISIRDIEALYDSGI